MLHVTEPKNVCIYVQLTGSVLVMTPSSTDLKLRRIWTLSQMLTYRHQTVGNHMCTGGTTLLAEKKLQAKPS